MCTQPGGCDLLATSNIFHFTMANVFEQLENLDSVSEPRQAFEDIVTSMLLDCGYTDGRVKVFVGDGGIDAFKG